MIEPKGQILPDSEFGKVLTELAREADTILEIGTWHGEGSTRCIANGLMYREQRFITIEQDPSMHAEAKSRYDDPRINFIRAHTLDVIDQLPNQIDLILFDGDDLSTSKEFEVLAPRATVVALDDTNEIKNREQAQMIRKSSDWIILHDQPKDRLGWMVARKANEYDKIYAGGGWDGKGSGPGSSPRFTLDFRIKLESLMAEQNIRSALDYGCGDWSWQCAVLWPVNFEYYGWDLSHAAIQTAQRWPPVNRTIKQWFFVGDPALRPHRVRPADLLIVKDVMHHATFEERLRIIELSRRFPWVLWVVDMQDSNRPCFWPEKELPKWELFHQFDTSVEDYRYGPKSAWLQRNN